MLLVNVDLKQGRNRVHVEKTWACNLVRDSHGLRGSTFLPPQGFFLPIGEGEGSSEFLTVVRIAVDS